MFTNIVEMLLHATNTPTTEEALPHSPPAAGVPHSQSDTCPNSPATSLPSSSASIAENATFVAASTTQNDSFLLSITTQPPSKTVYQRILKPFPTVTLTVAKDQEGSRRSRASPLSDDAADEANNDVVNLDQMTEENAGGKDKELATEVLDTLRDNSSNSSSNGLFVEASLLRGDTGEPISKCLDGNCIVRFEKSPWAEGVYTATFKKLKILSTSQQLQGILFRLKFTLKKYVGSAFTTVMTPDIAVTSHPVEVFSHSQYLNKKASKPSTHSANTRKDFRDIVKKMDGKKVHDALVSVLQAFKEQGGSRSSVLEVVQQVYGEDDSKVRGVPRRMSAPSSYSNTQPQLAMSPPLAPVPTNDTGPTAVEMQFLSDLLGNLQMGAMSPDDFVNHLLQGLGKPRASQLLAQMGIGVDQPAATLVPSFAAPLATGPVPLPSYPTTAALDSSNSLAAILNALAHQQTQLAQLQAVQHSQQLGAANSFLQQLHEQQALLQQQIAAASSPVVPPALPKPRRRSSSRVPTSPPSSVVVNALPYASFSLASSVPTSSTPSSLCTLADAISSHLQQQTTTTSTSTSSSSSTACLMPLLPPASSLLDLHSFSSSPSSNVTLPPISAALSSASSASYGPLPSLSSLSSLASAVDHSEQPPRDRKRSFEASGQSLTATTATAYLPSPSKLTRSETDADVASAFSSSSSRQGDEEKVQWYWKNNTAWEPYADGVSAQLERDHKDQTPCIMVLHDVPYKMDFQSMTQQRIDNPKRWKHIRRGEN